MNPFDQDQPLGDQFNQNPYQFVQGLVRNMNNQIFLSEYQLSHLYSLLLLKRQSPWDSVKPNDPNLKTQFQQIVNKKLVQVKKILEGLSQVYQNRVKKNALGQIQRLMNIIKARNKSIFIEKDMEFYHRMHIKKQKQQKTIENQIKLKSEDLNSSLISIQNLKKTHSNQQIVSPQHYCKNQLNKNNNNQQQVKQQQYRHQQERQRQIHLQNHTDGDQRQVLSLFYGLANLPNLSSLALTNCLQYSSAERFIKFKMSRNYIMTIKNQDQQPFDRSSDLRHVSSDIFIHHIFPYLTSVQLFKVREVCKQWMQNVKQAWHSTFKRQMFIQLLACQFCKEIQFYYKLIQLRNPFFQKITLLMHALLQIIQWDKVHQSIQNNTIVLLQKRVLIILLKLLGQPIILTNLNSITEQIWNVNKQKILTIKQRIGNFLNDMGSSVLSIIQLLKIKINLLDDPFMRVQEVNSQDKTPLLLVIFIKQMTLQQTLKNHICFSQEYLMNTKKKLDNLSSKMPQQKGFLEGVYKILLLKNMNPSFRDQNDEGKNQLPNFQDLLNSIFSNSQSNTPDFSIKSKSSSTNIYLDKATKLDIIVSTVRKLKSANEDLMEQKSNAVQQQKSQNEQQILKDSQSQSQSNPNNQTKKQFKTVNMYSINLNQNKQNIQQKIDFQQNIKESQIIEEGKQKEKQQNFKEQEK